MPPCLDVYVVADREREVIERFLDGYVDRTASEDRGDEQLMLLVPGAVPDESAAWEWQPAGTLTRVVARGLAQPWRAFQVYLRPRHASHDRACLAFTVDGRIVLGVSLDDPSEEDARLDDARALQESLAREFAATAGFIGYEEPPPLTATNPRGRWLVRWSEDAV